MDVDRSTPKPFSVKTRPKPPLRDHPQARRRGPQSAQVRSKRLVWSLTAPFFTYGDSNQYVESKQSVRGASPTPFHYPLADASLPFSVHLARPCLRPLVPGLLVWLCFGRNQRPWSKQLLSRATALKIENKPLATERPYPVYSRPDAPSLPLPTAPVVRRTATVLADNTYMC